MRTVPGFRSVIVAHATAVEMSDYRRTLRAARPVLAGAILGGSERTAVRLRSRQHVMPVRLIAGAVENITFLAQRALLGQVVGAVQLGDVLCDHDAFGIFPRPPADAVARIHRRLTVDGLGREVSAPRLGTGARGLRQGLAMVVGAGEATEIAAIADAVRGQEETGIGRLRLG